MNQYFTEFIKKISIKEVSKMEKVIGASCDKCGIETHDLYHRKYYFDGLPNHQTLCQTCKDKLEMF